jgi:hypothetical protein
MNPWHYKMTLNDEKNPGVKLSTPTFMLFPFWQSTHFFLTPGRSLSISLASTKTLFLASNEVQWWKIQLARSHFWAIIQATNQLTKDPNHCFSAITIDLDTSNG